MKFISLLFIALSTLTFSATPTISTPGSTPEIVTELTQAVVGVNPATGAASGWYTSNVTIHILAPDDVMVNRQLTTGGHFTISDEGKHQLELQPGPLGQANTVTQFVNIDKTAPQVIWITQQNFVISEYSSFSAKITDAISGICSIESSFDYGSSWNSQKFPVSLSGVPGVVQETTWSVHVNSQEFAEGTHVILLRAYDCAGNVSPGELLVFRVNVL